MSSIFSRPLLWLLYFTSGLTFQTFHSFASYNLYDCPWEPGAKCPQCEGPLVRKVLKLVKQAEEAGRFPTGEAFIEALPKVLRGHPLFMGESDSPHSATPDMPRVLLKSLESEVVVAFSTNPRALGYEIIEMIYWSGLEGIYKRLEMHFPEDAALVLSDLHEENEGLTYLVGPQEGKPSVHWEANHCTYCHGKPFKPLWESYNFWPLHIPAAKDRLSAHSSEREWYLNILKDIEGDIPRLKHLKPKDSLALISKDPNSNYRLGYDFNEPNITGGTPNEGPSTRLFDQLSTHNQCTIIQQIRSHPLFRWIKYALVAGAACTNLPMAQFIPEWARSQFDSYFKKRGIPKSKQKFTFSHLLSDTHKHHILGFDERLERQKEFLRKYLNNFQVNEAISDLNHEGSNYDLLTDDIVAGFRYLLEPLDFDIDEWSLSTNPFHYSFGDAGFPFRVERREFQGLFDRELENEFPGLRKRPDLCKFLTDKSLATFEEIKNLQDENKASLSLYRKGPLIMDQTNFIRTQTLKPFRKKAGMIFEKYRCRSCHTGSTRVGPMISFDDFEGFERTIQKDPQVGKKILKRIQLSPETKGFMPMKIGKQLNPIEIAALKKYIQQVSIR